MKKIIVLLSVVLLPVLAGAQEKNFQRDHTDVVISKSSLLLMQHPEQNNYRAYFIISPEELTDKISQEQVYQEFDRYYYEYALQFISRACAKQYLNVIRDFRRDSYATPKTEEELKARKELYNDQVRALYDQFLFSYNEQLVLGEYLNRPSTPERMLATEKTYQEYEEIVYNNIYAQLTTAHAKDYLAQAKVLREKFAAKANDMAKIYAGLREILDNTQGKYTPLMDATERDLAETYLSKAVSVDGVGVSIPLDKYFSNYRRTLTWKQRSTYVTAHYEK